MNRSYRTWIACLLFLFAAPAVADAAPAMPVKSASWVWSDLFAGQNDQGNEPRYLRRSFTLPARPADAELKITADNNYTVFINGEKIGQDGNWNNVDSYDVAKYLRQGSNALAIVATNAGGPAGVIAWLRVKTEDKQETVVATDREMRVSLTAPEGWLTADFDDSKWAKVAVLGKASMGPWNILGGNNPSGSGQPGTSRVADKRIQHPLSPKEQHGKFLLPDDFEIELVAAEPLLINPVTMTIDEAGRIYVSESHTYRFGPNGSPVKPFKNPLIRLDPQPDGKSYRRVLVADGFDEPVMGIAVRGDKLWCTACDYLYQFDLLEDGKATNRRTLLIDKNKAWNPFGMFVLEWGPEGELYMSVGNHNIDIRPPGEDGKPAANGPSISGRGSSGIVMRMKPDGSQMQRLVHGLRVPYSFEFDPFGQLWVLSNGEGNPNRFVRVIEGVDYHCYSRNVSQDWLKGNHPLAPPCFELPAGARTQLMRYYGAAYPRQYEGMLLLDNWGQHGFGGGNRSVFRYTTDERNDIVEKDAFVSCTDPRFRCSHVILDNDGNLLVADWYGRDDESDLTGRIWRVKYKGDSPLPEVRHKLGGPRWNDDGYAISALGSPDHRVREQAIERLQASGIAAVELLGKHAARAPEPLGAANALWTLTRIGTPTSLAAIANGAKHPDWRVRRLTVNLLRRYQLPQAAEIALALAGDSDAAVRVEAALAQRDSQQICAALIDALRGGAAEDTHLRYEAAWHLARNASGGVHTSPTRERGSEPQRDPSPPDPSLARRASVRIFEQLLADPDANVQLAGLIAIDVARYEGFDSKQAASVALNQRLANPGELSLDLLMELVTSNPDAEVAEGLRRMIAQPKTPVAAKARGLLVLRSLPGGLSDELIKSAGKNLLEAAEAGEVRLTSNDDWLLLLKLMEGAGPNDFAIRQLMSLSGHGDAKVRQAALSLARRFGSDASPLVPILWQRLLDPKHPTDRRLEIIGTLTSIDPEPSAEKWQRLLTDADRAVRTDAVRSWRAFAKEAKLVEFLAGQRAKLAKDVPALAGDLEIVLQHLYSTSGAGQATPSSSDADKRKLAAATLQALEALPAERQKTAHLLGRRVFERSACVKCHTTVTENTPRAPSLQGIGRTQKPDYLVESVLHPSKVIKTGFETELIVTVDGKTFSGLVRDEGEHLRVFEADRETVLPKAKIEERAVVKQSLMPEGQEQQLSREEFVDLVAYLISLR